MITTLKLDESTKLEFDVAITGTSKQPEIRFIIEGTKFSTMIPCKQVNGSVKLEIPPMLGTLQEGKHDVRLEVVIDGKLYTPLKESITFSAPVAVTTKTAPVVKTEVVEITSSDIAQVDESYLRKVQAATIIAQALKYEPGMNESPAEIIQHSIEQNVGEMTPSQIETVNEMLNLAESVGIDVKTVMISQSSYRLPLVPFVEQAEQIETEAIQLEEADKKEITDDEIDDILDELEDDDFYDAYDDEELSVVDDETGTPIDENTSEVHEQVLNEVLSKVERMKARIRMARTSAKREMKLRMALKKHSTTGTINKRARRMAVKAMEKKLAKKPLSQLSVAEKERIERMISARKAIIGRLAMKLTPKIRALEKDRLSHHSYTKSA